MTLHVVAMHGAEKVSKALMLAGVADPNMLNEDKPVAPGRSSWAP